MSSDFSFNYKRIILSKEAQAKSDKNWDNIDWNDDLKHKQTVNTNKLSAKEKDEK